ncbi:ABC transporter permease [Kordiimonas gwangyangensis]|uniref:ABC transporter permease n=1 Tax=Kordiimonas gwangyangensis TaxID=288022 RepID=UPI0003729FB3|nr:ABC transporter permease [Kordiimonas gwangyangensis]
MFQNYINVALRNLFKNKLYSAINIIGLAVGLAACIMIMLFVRDELSYDRFWSKADNIYRLNTTFNPPGREPFVTVMAQGPTKHALKTYFPEEVEHVTRFNSMRVVMQKEQDVFSEILMWTDPETVDIFDFDVVAGDLRRTLNDNASLAINETFARKYFGEEDAIGQTLTLSVYSLKRDYRIGAVYKDLPHNTVLEFQGMAMIDEKDFVDQEWEFTQWFSVNNYVYFTLKPGVSVETINQRLDGFTNQFIEIPDAALGGQSSDYIHYSTQPITDIQLDPAGARDGEMKATGDMATVITFSAIAGLILVIACINFMNLATAKSTQRAREVALRKVLGAKRRQLVTQFLGESVLIALIGLVFGVVLVEVMLPSFGGFVDKELTFNYLDPLTISILLGLVAIVGVLGGVYPALILSGFRPAYVLKANKSSESTGSARLRNVLVVMQFAISIALIVSTGVVYGQKVYATNMDPGFNKENLIVVRNTGRSGAIDKRDAFKEQVARLPGVKSVAFSSDAPASGNESNNTVRVPSEEGERSVLIGSHRIDYEFFDTYEIPMLAGRAYSREYALDVSPNGFAAEEGALLQSNLIVNEGAVRRFGFASPQDAIGKIVKMGVGNGRQAEFTIIGVIPDTKFQSVREVMRPEMYFLAPYGFNNLNVRYEGNPTEVVGRIEALWKSMITEVPFAYDYVDDVMAEEFVREENQSILLAIFAGLAVVIACLGLYGLASFTAERRTKEIGIRKVMGASVFDIVRLLLWQFSKPVLLANLIAWPIAIWGMLTWLENFPYRIEAWVLLPLCLVAGVIALTIAWATVGGNAARVARSNPIDALRYE